MTIGFAGTKYDTYLSKLSHQKISFQAFSELLKSQKKAKPDLTFADVMPLITKSFGLTPDITDKEMGLSEYETKLLSDAFAQSVKKEKDKSESLYLLYGDYDPLVVTITHILNRKAGIGWTSYAHTGIPVVTYATGSGQELFDGFYDNTDIFKKLVSIMKLQ